MKKFLLIWSLLLLMAGEAFAKKINCLKGQQVDKSYRGLVIYKGRIYLN
jgi:hypothetical protein